MKKKTIRHHYNSHQKSVNHWGKTDEISLLIIPYYVMLRIEKSRMMTVPMLQLHISQHLKWC